ncbi:thioredoxin [Streptosporangium sp. CA-135522]|uniref:thioredoxin n=1 Tax=Streptosporangium sp. CA-135522 TaxID=3240072 RepID=UPI003D8DE425
MATKTVTTDTFAQSVLTSDKPVLVDFWADWCHPCHMLAPVLEQLADERADDLVVAKVDVDAYPELAEQYGVRAFPTLKLFRAGRVVHTLVGATPKRVLVAELADHL